MCLADGSKFVLPAYPATEVRDPTGAGDSFAGGLMGYLAQVNRTDFDTLKTAVAYGTVVASFTIADFSLSGLTSVTRRDIDIAGDAAEVHVLLTDGRSVAGPTRVQWCRRLQLSMTRMDCT